MIDPRKAALVIIDMQYRLLNPSSALCAAGAAAAVPACARALNRTRDLGMPAFHAIRAYAADGANVEDAAARGWMKGSKPVSHTPEAQARTSRIWRSSAPHHDLRRILRTRPANVEDAAAGCALLAAAPRQDPFWELLV